MGLAASQGRLLLLTARRSDLEFRGQQISQRRMQLMKDLESVSAEYTRKTGNRQLKLSVVNQGETNQMTTVNLTYDNLVNLGNAGGDADTQMYRIVNAHGKIVVPSDSDIPSGANEKDYQIDPSITTAVEQDNYFQEGLRNGRFIIETFTQTDASGNIDEDGSQWRAVSWAGMTEIQDDYYTEDDALAEAIYQQESAKVQALDKQLEIDQQQIETQHKAVTTEVDSVEKIIKDNTEKSFKTFDG